MGVSVINSSGPVASGEFAANHHAAHGNPAAFKGTKADGVSNTQIAALFGVSSREIDVYESSLERSPNASHGGTNATDNPSQSMPWDPAAAVTREIKTKLMTTRHAQDGRSLTRVPAELDIAKASDILYGPGEKTYLPSIGAALYDILIGPPEDRAKKIVEIAVSSGVNAAQLLATGMISNEQLDIALKSLGITPESKSPRAVDSIQNAGLYANVSRVLSDPTQLPYPVDTASIRTLVYGAGNKSISNVDLDLAVDVIWNKYQNNPNEAVWAILKAVTPLGVSAQQLASLGKPYLPYAIIADTFATKGVKRVPEKWIQNPGLARAVDIATKEAASTRSSDDWDLSSDRSVRILFGVGNKELSLDSGDMDQTIRSMRDLNLAFDAIESQLADDPDRAAMTMLATMIMAKVSISQVARLGRPGLTREAIVNFLEFKGINPPPTVTSEQLAASKATLDEALEVETNAYAAFQKASPADYEHAGQVWVQTRNDLKSALDQYRVTGQGFKRDIDWEPDFDSVRTPVLRSDGAATTNADIAAANYDAATSTIFSMLSNMVEVNKDKLKFAWSDFLKVEKNYKALLDQKTTDSSIFQVISTTHEELSTLLTPILIGSPQGGFPRG